MLSLSRGTPWLLLVVAVMAGAVVARTAVPTDLDLKLMQEVTTNLSKNEAISPFVMSTLMTQLWLGAGGTTRDEMTPVLGLHDVDFLGGYSSAISYLSSGTSNVTVAVFNRIYVRDTFTVKPTFSNYLIDFYHASAESFSSASEAAEEINGDVATVTQNRIPELVNALDLHDSSLVLVSALYFKGLWQHPFNPAVKSKFLTADGEKQVDMMNLNVTYLPYANLTTFDAVALPYLDSDYWMLLIRPADRNMSAVAAVRDALSSLNITDTMEQLVEMPVHVSMPRFKIEADYKLPPAMSALGIREIFQHNADLSGITDDALSVSDIIHKVFIEVTEEGTEAAGAGAVIFSRMMPPHFELDRPFFAVVYNKQHNINLFSAYVASPSVSSGTHEEFPSPDVGPPNSAIKFPGME